VCYSNATWPAYDGLKQPGWKRILFSQSLCNAGGVTLATWENTGVVRGGERGEF
jgi:chitodextrinase